MRNSLGRREKAKVGLILCSLFLVLTLGGVQQVRADEATTIVEQVEKPNFFVQVLNNLFNSGKLIEILGQPEYALLAFVALNLIVFTETGLFFGFFLPGDSLLVVAGVVCFGSGWSLPLLLTTLCLSAIIGDSVGYTIGWHSGPKIFCRENSLLFHKDHLLKAQEFYDRHGGKTIILARFMPLIRTFAPVVAGVGRMKYSSFLFFNVIGGIGWVLSMVLIGYYLPTVINPAFKPIFGPDFEVRDHIEKVVILVVLLSISPGIVVWLKKKFGGKATGQEPLLGDQQKPSSYEERHIEEVVRR